MRLKLRELVSSKDMLQHLATLKCKPAAAMTVARVLRAVRPEMEELETQRQRMLKEYGAVLPEGAAIYTFPDGQLAAFDAEFSTLLDEEIDLPLGTGVRFEDMGLAEVEPGVVDALWWLWHDPNG